MNPLYWGDALQRLQTDIMENGSETDNIWHIPCQYQRYAADEPQNRPQGLCPPAYNFHVRESEVDDPDGEPLEIDEEDPELIRKQRELREIEEQIMHKKYVIALKAVQPCAETSSPAFPPDEPSVTCSGATLKDRVNVILRQRRPVSFLSNVHPPKDRTNSFGLSKDDVLQEEHPLKLRVKTLMKQRCSDPCVLPSNRKVLSVTQPLPSRSVTSPAKENNINQGFQRFLSVLNKGVDMDFLSRIVNDDSEELVNVHPPDVEAKSDLPIGSESQRSNSRASLPGHTGRTYPSGRERSLSDHLPDEDQKKRKERGAPSLDSNSRSRSPPAVKKKKKDDKENPEVDEKHEHLQNILKTLGLNLEMDEMKKLANRTQERLYGKTNDDMTAESRKEQETQHSDFHRPYGISSSSSRSPSTSRSVSSSPSRRQRTSKPRHSRDRSRDGLICQDDNQDSREGPKHSDSDATGFRETYDPYLQNQTYPHPQPAASAAYPEYSYSQHSQYNMYQSDWYSEATHSYSSYPQGPIPPSLYPSEYPYPYHHSPQPVTAPETAQPRQKPVKDVNMLMNPDLSASEGQIGSSSGPRCLQVISLKQNTQRCLKQVKKRIRNRGNLKKQRFVRKQRKALKKEFLKQIKWAAAEAKARALQQEQDNDDDDDDDQDSDEESEGEDTQLPTEEEIKANLRKKLEAFNQKMKQKQTDTQLDTSQTSQTGSDE